MYEGNGPHPIRMPESLTFFVSLPSRWRQQPQQYPHRTAFIPVCVLLDAHRLPSGIYLVYVVRVFFSFSFCISSYQLFDSRTERALLTVRLHFLFGFRWHLGRDLRIIHHIQIICRIAAAAAPTDPFQQLVRSATFHIPP